VTAEYYRQGAPTLYTADEAAGILRVKKSWLERQAAARKIPFTVLGGSYRFTSAHLAEIVRMYEQAPTRQIESRSRGARPRRPDAPSGAGTGQLAPLRSRPRGGPHRMARSSDPAA
jgi:excisionase family DNA binding protein